MLHYPVRRGEIMNFISFVERDDWQVESWVTQGTKDELANDFRGWHDDVHEMIARIETPYKWALMCAAPMPRWSRGRVTLLGDACHPTLPFLGQGGVMAIEDGYIVAACLDKYFADPAAAFARYEEIRRERTATVVRKAHENRRSAFSPALAEPRARWRSKSRANGSRSACASGWSGCTPTTRPPSRSSASAIRALPVCRRTSSRREAALERSDSADPQLHIPPIERDRPFPAEDAVGFG